MSDVADFEHRETNVFKVWNPLADSTNVKQPISSAFELQSSFKLSQFPA